MIEMDINLLGAFVAGYATIEIIKLFVKHLYKRVEGGDFLSKTEFQTYKDELAKVNMQMGKLLPEKEFIEYKVQRNEALRDLRDATEKDLHLWKEACERHKSSCAQCIQQIKDNQTQIRRDWPQAYVYKEDFKEWRDSWEQWLKSIDDKVNKILDREIQEGKVVKDKSGMD